MPDLRKAEAERVAEELVGLCEYPEPQIEAITEALLAFPPAGPAEPVGEPCSHKRTLRRNTSGLEPDSVWCEDCGALTTVSALDEWQLPANATPAEAGSLEAVLRHALVFQRKTWPNATPKSCAAHLAKEAKELKASARDPHEVADAMLLVSHLAHLAGIDLSKAVRDKLEILRARKWGEPDADGVVEHVRPTCQPPSEEA